MMLFFSIVLFLILLLISIEDISKLIIPNYLCLSGSCIGLIYIAIKLGLKNPQNLLKEELIHLAAGLSALIIMILIKIISEKITNRICLGLGDAKLSFMGGIWLGFNGILIVLMMSYLSAGLFSILGRLTIRIKKFQPFPFAPFISLFIYAVWILGEDWWIQNFLPL